jgi:hypothetical protein
VYIYTQVCAALKACGNDRDARFVVELLARRREGGMDGWMEGGRGGGRAGGGGDHSGDARVSTPAAAQARFIAMAAAILSSHAAAAVVSPALPADDQGGAGVCVCVGGGGAPLRALLHQSAASSISACGAFSKVLSIVALHSKYTRALTLRMRGALYQRKRRRDGQFAQCAGHTGFGYIQYIQYIQYRPRRCTGQRGLVCLTCV